MRNVNEGIECPAEIDVCMYVIIIMIGTIFFSEESLLLVACFYYHIWYPTSMLLFDSGDHVAVRDVQ